MSYTENFRPYYSQNREDVLLSVFLCNVKNGKYIDIGAADPVEDSVTKLFYDRGWSGLNIEANPSLYNKLNKSRKRDINLNVAVSDRSDSEVTLRVYKKGLSGHSTISEEEKSKNSKSKKHVDYKDVTVQNLPLSAIMQSHFKTDLKAEIHFLKIDVEGSEASVLNSNDWSKYRPWLICTEISKNKSNQQEILTEAKYKKIYEDGINDYYVAEEKAELYKIFIDNYVNQVVENKPYLKHYVLKHIKKVEGRVEDCTKELANLHNQYAEMKSDYESVKEELESFKSFKFTVKYTLKLFKEKLLERAGLK